METSILKSIHDPKVVVALDYSNAQDALEMAAKLSPSLCRLKVGKELFTAAGPHLVEALQKMNYDVFLDLKFHDIPNTTAKAVAAAGSLGVWMVNVHASGGEVMMSAAAEALHSFKEKPLLIGVTILTSFSEQGLRSVGIENTIDEQVLKLASLTKDCGLDGVVCSAQEVEVLKASLGKEFCLVTPGIRPLGSSQDDQTRIVTPQKAIQLGSHYLVMGRPVRNHENPCEMLETLNAQLADIGA